MEEKLAAYLLIFCGVIIIITIIGRLIEGCPR